MNRHGTISWFNMISDDITFLLLYWTDGTMSLFDIISLLLDWADGKMCLILDWADDTIYLLLDWTDSNKELFFFVILYFLTFLTLLGGIFFILQRQPSLWQSILRLREFIVYNTI